MTRYIIFLTMITITTLNVMAHKKIVQTAGRTQMGAVFIEYGGETYVVAMFG